MAWHGVFLFFHRPRLGLCSALLVKFAKNNGQGVIVTTDSPEGQRVIPVPIPLYLGVPRHAVGPVAASCWIRRIRELGRLAAEAGQR